MVMVVVEVVLVVEVMVLVVSGASFLESSRSGGKVKKTLGMKHEP